MMPHNQPQSGCHLIWDDDLRTALRKSKLIEKRINKRKQLMKLKLKQFKDICKQIRLHEQDKQDKLQKVDEFSHIFNNNHESVASLQSHHQMPDEMGNEDGLNQNQNLSRQNCQSQKKDQVCILDDHMKGTEIQNLNYENLPISDERKFNQQEKNDSSGIQISDYSTPRFNSVEQVESPFLIINPKQSSSVFDNVTFEKQKQQMEKQEHSTDLLHQSQMQIRHVSHNFIHQTQLFSQSQFYMPKFDCSSQIIFQNFHKQNDPSYFIPNYPHFESVMQSNNHYVNNQVPSRIFDHNLQQQNVKEESQMAKQQKNYLYQIDLSKLQINPNFIYHLQGDYKIGNYKKRLFNEKKQRKNSSDKLQND